MSRERKRGKGGDRGIGTVAEAASNSYTLPVPTVTCNTAQYGKAPRNDRNSFEFAFAPLMVGIQFAFAGVAVAALRGLLGNVLETADIRAPTPLTA